MSSVRMRPTFSVRTSLPADDAMRHVRRSVEAAPEHWQGQFASRHAMISPNESLRHFWSPWLHLEVREWDQDREVFGRFSPHPSLWTAIMFSGLALGVLAFFAACLGVSQQLAGEFAWGWFAIPVFGLIGLLVWLGSQLGQRLASDQMVELRDRVEALFREPRHVPQGPLAPPTNDSDA